MKDTFQTRAFDMVASANNEKCHMDMNTLWRSLFKKEECQIEIRYYQNAETRERKRTQNKKWIPVRLPQTLSVMAVIWGFRFRLLITRD